VSLEKEFSNQVVEGVFDIEQLLLDVAERLYIAKYYVAARSSDTI
jgi:hypothetical protein